MEDVKVKVNNEAESKEAQELFFELGYGWHGKGKKLSYSEKILGYGFGWLVLWKPDCLVNKVIQIGTGFESVKEITIEQLRDMVVLKRNDPKDANYESENGRIKYYLTSSEFFEFMNGVWVNIDELASGVNFKPIKKDQSEKEYLDENFNLVYGSGVYEVPEGAEVAILYKNNVVEFYKDDYKNCWHIDNHFWFDCSESPKFYKSGSVVWQRNNKCADIEAPSMMFQRCLTVDTTLNQRQSQYGSFANVAATTQNLYDLTRRDDMSNVQCEALHMICSKLARIANGDPNHVDSWHDIAGYATLVVQDLEQ